MRIAVSARPRAGVLTTISVEDWIGNYAGADLGRFRTFLLLLARMQLGEQFRGKLAASDVVQQALLEAHENRGRFCGYSEAELAAWLRQIRRSGP